MKYKLLKKQDGLSLLETIFALGILILVVVAVLGLVTSNLAGKQQSENALIANNLAREGIEVVRFIRDSNWLAGDPWTDGLTFPTISVVPSFTNADEIWTNTWVLREATMDDSDATLYLSTISPIGIYNQGFTATGEETNFRRVLELQRICTEANSQNEFIRPPTEPCPVHLGYYVTARVEWDDRGRTQELVVNDFLYAWK